jgi:hypothetical protein
VKGVDLLARRGSKGDVHTFLRGSPAPPNPEVRLSGIAEPADGRDQAP